MLFTSLGTLVFAEDPMSESAWSEYIVLYQNGGRVRQDGFRVEAQKGFTGGGAGAWFEFDFDGTEVEILGQYEDASYDVKVDGATILTVNQNDKSNVVSNNRGSRMGDTLFKVAGIAPHPVQGSSHTFRVTKTSAHGNMLSLAIVRDANRPASESPWRKWEAMFGPRSSNKVNIIYDTDMNTDVDDAGAHAMLLSAAQLQPERFRLLAVIVSEGYAYSAPTVDAFNRYYGFGDIPVGTNKDTGINIHGQPNKITYPNFVATTYYHEMPNNGWGARDANEVYRSVLAKAEDRSVILVITGVPAALFNLYKTPANWNGDGLPSGKEMVDSKVKLITCMCNHAQGAGFGDYAIVNVPQLHSTLGSWVATGGRRAEMAPDNPIRISYDMFCPPDKDGSIGVRDSWDLVVMDYSLHGLSDNYVLQRGRLTAKGFVADNTGNVAHLMYRRWEKQIRDRLDEQLIAGKKGDMPLERRVTVDSRDPAIVAEGFTRLDKLGGNDNFPDAEWYSFQTVLRSTAADATATYDFAGGGIEVYGGGSGTVEISIDGKPEKTLSVSANLGIGPNGTTRNVPSGRLFRKEFDTAGRHTLTIKTVDDSVVSLDHFNVINPVQGK